MSTQVLIHKKTGDIFEGFPVWLSMVMPELLFDHLGSARFRDPPPDGWIIRNPTGMGEFFIFINQEFITRDFECLGELEGP